MAVSSFEFATVPRIIFGSGTRSQMAALAASFGPRGFVVSGGNSSRHTWLWEQLRASGLSWERFELGHEPKLGDLEQALPLLRAASPSWVLGLGGGSVLDLAKALGALANAPGAPLDYLEVVGGGKKLSFAGLPILAVPTTAGTGAEVTRNAVLEVSSHRVKVSLRGAQLLPQLAIVDPELCLSASPSLTAESGCDAVVQVLEPYLSRMAHLLSDALCERALGLASRALRAAYHCPQDLEARELMSFVSLSGGLALTTAKLGAVHGLAGPLGGLTGAPHGGLCARLLPATLEVNLAALRARDPGGVALSKFAQAAALVLNRPEASPEDLCRWAYELVEELRIPSLQAYGLAATDFELLCEQAMRSSSMAGNPIVLQKDEVKRIVQASF